MTNKHAEIMHVIATKPTATDYSRLPEHMREGFQRWIEQGIEMGDFGMAVLRGDLFEAFSRADAINTARMRDIVMFLYNDAPHGCYGSPAKVEAWRKAHKEARR